MSIDTQTLKRISIRFQLKKLHQLGFFFYKVLTSSLKGIFELKYILTIHIIIYLN